MDGKAVGIESARGEIRYRCRHDAHSLGVDLSQGGTADDGRIRVSTSRSPQRLTLHVHALEDVDIDAFALFFERSFRRNERFLLNGYQSWTDSREFSAEERIHPFPPLFRPILERIFRTNRYGDYDVVQAAGSHLHGFTYFYICREEHGQIEFFGSLSEAEGFTVFRVFPDDRRVVVQKDCDGLTLGRGDEWKAFDLHVETGDEDAVFSNYLARCHDVSGLEPRSAAPWTGYTTWYQHYTNITQQIVLDNLEAFGARKVPIDIFQIDDGWQSAVGDWLHVNEKFPQGMRALADRIHEAGYRAGLWLAPFVAERKSLVISEHPEWFLRDAAGNPVPAGNSNLWSGDFYALDLYDPGFRDYLTTVFHSILHEWKFDLVKLDFLYGACLAPGGGRTRGRKMVDAMDFLRRLAGDKLILGCGVPLGPAIGRVEVCRIGPDVGHEWANTLTRGLGIRETISTVTALENAMGRRHLSGRAFSNDPDVFFLRRLSFDGQRFDPVVALQELRWGKRIPLTDAEKYTLFLLNNIFGRLVFTSDDINEYSDEVMSLYLSSFPLREKRNVRVTLAGKAPTFGEVGGCYEIRFQIGTLEYLAYANLSNDEFTTTLGTSCFSRDTRGRGRFHAGGESLTLKSHASMCFLEEPAGDVALLGSESHLFPGSDIAEWTRERDESITVRRSTLARGKGQVVFRVPRGRSGIRINGIFVFAKSHFGRENMVVVDANSPQVFSVEK